MPSLSASATASVSGEPSASMTTPMPSASATSVPTGSTCPDGTSFCWDFESAELPAGVIHKLNAGPADWSEDFVIDTAVKYAGASSMRVKKATEMGATASAYKMLAIPTPAANFWFRVQMRADGVLGQGTTSTSEHNSLIIASTSDVADKNGVEIADDCGFAFNASDNVWRKGSGNGTCDEAATLRLPANEWYCVEGHFDGTTGTAQLYVNGELEIDAMNWQNAKGTFTHLKIGVYHLHALDRSVWYDDLAIATTRVGCN
jgi:hypothetical protein